MNALGKLFLKGLAVTIPVALTLAIAWWLAAGAERLLGQLLILLLPQGWYVPGMGLISAMALILLVGLLSHVIIFQRLFEWGESVLARLPLIKTIYSALKDFFDYFSGGGRQSFSKVVMVKLPGHEFEALGFDYAGRTPALAAYVEACKQRPSVQRSGWLDTFGAFVCP